MKTIITEYNGEYLLRTPKGETWHLKPTSHNSFRYETRRVSTDKDHVMTGNRVRGRIPNHIKTVVFEILRGDL